MFKKLLLTAILIAVLSSCGGGGSSPTSYSAAGITGVVQKGPLIFGSYVNAYLLDEKLNPTGQSYVARTTDDLGNFAISSNISSSLVHLIATGYYFDEDSGSISTSPTTLSAIVDLTVTPTPTINVLTTLQEPRIKTLIGSGKTYTEAMQQSAQEVLDVFGVDPKKIEGYKSLYGMQINGNKDADGVLLATSTILAKMSAMAAANTSSSQAAQLSYFLSRIASDISNYGVLKTVSIKDAIKSAQANINLTSVRSNVETYYASRNVTLVAPKFEEWVDKDNSQKLPKRLVNATTGVFVGSSNVLPGTEVTSNELLVGEVGGSYIFAQLKFNTDVPPATLLVNGKPVNGLFSTVSAGDKLSIKTNAPALSGVADYTLTLGSQSLIYKVSSLPASEAVPKITYTQYLSGGLNPSIYGTALSIIPNISSELYFVIVSEGSSPPSIANIIEGKDVNGTSLSLSGNVKILPAEKETSVTLASFGSLQISSSYDVYLLVFNSLNRNKYLLEKINLPARALPASGAASGGSCVANC